MNVTKYAINTLIDTTTSLVHEITPLAVSSVIQAAYQDIRIAKIVTGLGFLSTGIWAIAGSGLQKTINSKIGIFQTKEPVTDPKTTTPLHETSSKKALRWSAASIGLVASCYGIYNIANGIMGFMTPPDSIALCTQSLEKTKEELLQCPAAKAVWDDVEKDGQLEIKCGMSLWDSAVDPNNRKIMVNPTLAEKVPQHLSDLISLRNAKNILQIFNNPCSVSADGYVKAMQTAQYQNAMTLNEISNKCVKDGHWPEKFVKLGRTISGDLSSDWNILESFHKQQEDMNQFRSYWQQKCECSTKKIDCRHYLCDEKI